jgi:hypothetical protein
MFILEDIPTNQERNRVEKEREGNGDQSGADVASRGFGTCVFGWLSVKSTQFTQSRIAKAALQAPLS